MPTTNHPPTVVHHDGVTVVEWMIDDQYADCVGTPVSTSYIVTLTFTDAGDAYYQRSECRRPSSRWRKGKSRHIARVQVGRDCRLTIEMCGPVTASELEHLAQALPHWLVAVSSHHRSA